MSKELHNLLTEMVKLYQERQCFLAVHAERLCALLPAAPAAPAPLTLREQLDVHTPWDELDAILTQNEKDAQRYRWVLNNGELICEDGRWSLCFPGPFNNGDEDAGLDEAIDAAIAFSKGGGK